MYLTPVQVQSSLKESWYVSLKGEERRVHVLKNTDNRVLLLHHALGALQRLTAVERSAKRSSI